MHSWDLHKLLLIFFLYQENKQQEKISEISTLYYPLNHQNHPQTEQHFSKKSKVELRLSFFEVSSYGFYPLLYEVFVSPF